MDLNASAASQPEVRAQRIGLFLCPSDLNDQVSGAGQPIYAASYAFGEAEWFSQDYQKGLGGDGAFPFVPYPQQVGVRITDITDGTANTAGVAEVKAVSPLLLQSSNLGSNLLEPSSPAQMPALGGVFYANGAHTSWAVAFMESTGLSFVFPPNTSVWYTNPADGQKYDVDWAGGGNYSYDVMTARSYHPGGVNTWFVDGSVRFITNSIEQATWRALGTRNGGEPVDASKY